MISHAIILKWIFRVLALVVSIISFFKGYYSLSIVLILMLIISFFEDYHKKIEK
jgi:thiamine transporter ThiT